MISSSTRVIPLIGSPVVQVKTPPLINARLTDSGHDAVMVPLDVPVEVLGSFFALLRASETFPGCSITIPHKKAAVRYLDTLTDRAQRTGSVNIVRRDADGTLHGDMTDGLAFISALGEHVDFGEISVAAVVGAAGGAGAAICDSLCKLGLRKLHLYDLAREQLVALAEMLNQAYPAVEVRLESEFRLAEADIVINCSPLGMRPDDPLPFAVETLKSTAVVADLVTSVEITPVLEAARKRGLIIQTGREMAADQIGWQLAHLGRNQKVHCP